MNECRDEWPAQRIRFIRLRHRHRRRGLSLLAAIAALFYFLLLGLYYVLCVWIPLLRK